MAKLRSFLVLAAGVVWTLFNSATEAGAQSNLISTGAVWRYFDAGQDLGQAWRSNAFEATSWAYGPAPLGFGDPGLATVILPDGPVKPITTYFRHEFFLPAPLNIKALTLRLACDDGAVVYLNGAEVYRRNLGPGTISAETPATALVEGVAETQFQTYVVSPYLAVPGTNVVAVELHQNLLGRTDGSFDLELVANLPLSVPEIRLTSPVNGATLPVAPVRLQVETRDLDGFVYLVRYRIDGEWVGEITGETFDFFWVPAGPGRHRVVAEAIDNSGRRRESAPVYFQVGDVSETRVVRGPYLQSGSSTGVVVRWRSDWPGASRVYYGTSPSDLDFVATGPAEVQDHVVALTGLRPDTTYYYNVGGEDGPSMGSTGSNLYFTTAPETSRPVRFWAIGDSGSANAAAAAVRDAYLDLGGRTDLWLMLGDNAYEEGTDDQYQRSVFEMYPSLLRGAVLWPTLGNHDAASLGTVETLPYLDVFTLPKNGEAGGLASGTELYYSFDYANIHFICLDAQISDRTPGGPMLTWLERDLEATAKDWIVAFWHHPPYTWGTHHSDFESQLIEMRQFALPVLERHGVDLVLCGHSHVYERSYLLNGHYGYSSNLQASMVMDSGSGSPSEGQAYRKPSGGVGANQGTVYVVCGCSGEGGYFPFPRHPAMVQNRSGFGSMVVDVDGLRMDVRFLTDEGDYGDWFAIDKRGPGPLVRPRLEIRPAGTGFELAWPTSQRRFQLERRLPLGGPAPWQSVPGLPGQFGREYRLWRPAEGSNEWFRLRSVP